MVGSESKWAKYKRKDKDLEKLQQDSNNAQKILQTVKELDIEKELQQHEEGLSVVVPINIKVFKHFEKYGFIVIAKLMEFIVADIEVYSSE